MNVAIPCPWKSRLVRFWIRLILAFEQGTLKIDANIPILCKFESIRSGKILILVFEQDSQNQ